MAKAPRYTAKSSLSGRIGIALCCSECSSRNYKTTKATREGASPLKLSKFCTHCNKHTLHVEGR